MRPCVGLADLNLTSAPVALIFLISAMGCCAASQKAYWDIKQKFMDTILFYKIGKVCSFGLSGCWCRHAAVPACICM